MSYKEVLHPRESFTDLINNDDKNILKESKGANRASQTKEKKLSSQK